MRGTASEYWYRNEMGEIIVNPLSANVLPRYRDWVLRTGAPSTNITRDRKVTVADRSGKTMQMSERDVAHFLKRGVIYERNGGFRISEGRGVTWSSIIEFLSNVN